MYRGGGMSWTDQRKISKRNPFFPQIWHSDPSPLLLASHSLSLKPSGREHGLWVVQSYKFCIPFKLQTQEKENMLQERIKHSNIEEVWSVATQHQNTMVCVRVCVGVCLKQWGGGWAEWDRNKRLTLSRQVQQEGYSSPFWPLPPTPAMIKWCTAPFFF